ncbi:hypothetical protein PLICRDRAFT_178228 [Plicaturopsis crispa FD-325 SS-3]|nr:hypothetical protein PLICRDRAFT_178228 [Plicaturopsis crispa FD-325 SS-3]
MSGQRTSLDLTHVLYDGSSFLSLALALVTLSPILLMASYAALAVQTREVVIIEMWAGQLLCEGFNWVLKRAIKQERPPQEIALHGYGFPSSHSQYMGYFAAFLICHLHFRHRFASTGSRILDRAWRLIIYLALSAWAGSVAYSRYYLAYHSPHQIIWGFGIGVAFGVVFYALAELVPVRWPGSFVARARTAIVDNPVSVWLEIRDGWAIWADGGREEEWKRWRKAWEARTRGTEKRTD